MLALTRKPGEAIFLFPNKDLDPDMTVKELFKAGPIEIKLVENRSVQNTVHSKIGIQAPDEIVILRDELYRTGTSKAGSRASESRTDNEDNKGNQKPRDAAEVDGNM